MGEKKEKECEGKRKEFFQIKDFWGEEGAMRGLKSQK